MRQYLSPWESVLFKSLNGIFTKLIKALYWSPMNYFFEWISKELWNYTEYLLITVNLSQMSRSLRVYYYVHDIWEHFNIPKIGVADVLISTLESSRKKQMVKTVTLL